MGHEFQQDRHYVLEAEELVRSRQVSGEEGGGEQILKMCNLGTHSTSI